ncbi:MAG: hypothetical protein GY749_23325 [Desulfobacteraceae bacterium]|nr:hypothetical protein [Desulfobacteraceae bacterium]
MNLSAIKGTEIIRELSLILDESLDRIRAYMDSVLKESYMPVRSNRILKESGKTKNLKGLPI